VTFEAADYLATSRVMLEKGAKMLTVELFDEAGRAAYLAAFHAAQALLFDRRGRAMKTHAGVQSEFGLLARTEPSLPAWLPGFLSRAFAYKSGADYGIGSLKPVTAPDATDALARAAEFVAAVASVLGPLQKDDNDA